MSDVDRKCYVTRIVPQPGGDENGRQYRVKTWYKDGSHEFGDWQNFRPSGVSRCP